MRFKPGLYRYPALLPFVFLSTGIILSGSRWAVPIAASSLLFAILLRKSFLYAVFFVAIGVLLVRLYPRSALERFVGKRIRLHLKVISPSTASIDSMMTGNGMKPFRGKIGIQPGFDVGSQIDATGFVAQTDNPYLIGNGIFHTFDVERLHSIVPPHGFRPALRQAIESEITSNVRDTLAAGLLTAFFLGNRHQVPFLVKESFRKAGIYHLFAISGLHIGILFTIFFMALRFLRLRKEASAFAAGLILTVYAATVGFSPSIIRALIMAWAFILSFLAGKRTFPINTLAIAGLISLFINPFYVFNLGFQLSYLATFGILLFLPLFQRLRPVWLVTPLMASVAAMAYTAPLLSHNFGYFSVMSPLTSFAGGWLLWLALTELLLGLFTGFYGFYAVSELAAGALIHLARAAGELPFSVVHIRPGVSAIILWYAVLTAAGVSMRHRQRSLFDADRR